MADHIIRPGAPVSAKVPYDALIRAIKNEGDELSRRIHILREFVAHGDFKALDPLDAHLLTLQLEHMATYLHILQIRLARFDEAKKGVLPAGAGALAQKPLIGKPN